MKGLGDWSADPGAVRPARQTAGLPSGYPRGYRRLVTLRDGRSVLIRPVLPSDAPALAESIQAAAERGIHTFTGMYLADNSPVAALIDAADEPAYRVTSRGITEFSVPLRPADPGP
jgi:hypothetical protein